MGDKRVHRYGRIAISGRCGRVSAVVMVMIGSLVILAASLGLALTLRIRSTPQSAGNAHDGQPVRVYCAAGVANAVERIMASYRAGTGASVELARTGGSGELLGQIQAERENNVAIGADLLISADDHLVQRGVERGWFVERIPLAQQRPVIAIRADSSIQIESLSDLIAAADSISFGIAQRSAAIGELTYQIARDSGLQDSVIRQSRMEAENVMMLAQALAAGSLEAAIVWDTTVGELNRHSATPVLKIAARLDDHNRYVGLLSAGIVAGSGRQHAARDFVHYMIAPEGGQAVLEDAGLEVVPRSPAPETSR